MYRVLDRPELPARQALRLVGLSLVPHLLAMLVPVVFVTALTLTVAPHTNLALPRDVPYPDIGHAVGEYQRTNNDAGIKIAGTTGDTSEQAFAALKDSPLIADVNRALGELRADGTLKQISEKYFGSDVSAAA